MSIYIIYFILTVLVVALMIIMVKLYKKGFKIEYKSDNKTYKNAKRNVRHFVHFLVEKRIDIPILTIPEKTAYSEIKKDIPSFDIDNMNNHIRGQIINYIQNKNDNNKCKMENVTLNLKNYLEQPNEENQSFMKNNLNIKDVSTIYTLLEKYKRDGNLGFATFTTVVGYNNQNNYLKRLEENYITEFVKSVKINHYKKNSCPKCGKSVKMISEDTKCPYCGTKINSDVWFLNNIKKI